MMRQYGELTFDIQKNSVHMFYNKQCVVFNTYNAPSRHKFDKFRNHIARNRRVDNLNEVFRVARIHEVRGTSGAHVIVHKNIAF